MKSDYTSTFKKIENIFNSHLIQEEILHESCKILKEDIDHYDWVGIYIFDKAAKQLVLGPFSGRPTDHTIIQVGKGVCGQVANTKMIKVVQDVQEEENYLSCGIDVRSEIVVPVLKNGEFIAELDIDSHSSAPFTKADEELLTKICEKISMLF